MYQITVEDTFAAGHYLRNYKGKCENPHGHNYRVRVTLHGRELDRAGLLLDFKEVKEAIKPMDQTSEAILALEPVTFRYKHELDPGGTPQFGLIAEQVEKINPDLVVRDTDGKINTVRYEAVNAMLLNEFLKEHRMVQELKSIVAKQEATAAQQQKQIEALTATVRKVSDQVALSKPAPQLVANP